MYINEIYHRYQQQQPVQAEKILSSNSNDLADGKMVRFAHETAS